MSFGCCLIKPLKGRKSISQILAHYNQNKKCFVRCVLNYYSGLATFQDVLSEAGKFHMDVLHCDPHQRRIYGTAKVNFANALQNASAQLQTCPDFSTLYLCLEKNCKPSGIGELAIYDTAMRIGAYLGKIKGTSNAFFPNDVYLHNGAMVGAQNLHRKNMLTKPTSQMQTSAFARLFPNQQAWEIEEILCIYKSNF